MRATPTMTNSHTGGPQMYNINSMGFQGYNANNTTGAYFANAEL